MRLRSSAMVAVFLLAVVAACGDDSGGGLPFDSSTTTSTTAAPVTTTTALVTTTTTPVTTVATTVPETTTTTAPALVPVQFRPDGIGFALFGDDAEAVIATAITYFGAITTDSGLLPGGFGDYGVCPGAQFRQVYFLGDTLMLMFSDVDYFRAGGVQNFVHYTYYAPDGTTVTDGPPTSIDLGNTVAQLQSMWPGVIVSGDDPLYGDTFYFEAGPGFDWLGGTLTGTTPTDTIEVIQGGVGCG
ncbi:MAG: hypothetical protein AAB198_04795, partial [Actinomycetota bacterium]